MTSIRCLVALCALASAPGLLRAAMVGETRVVPPRERAEDVVVVHDVRAAGDTVSGTVANRAPDPVRNVRLLIDHVWLWDDERHPGEDEFSRLDEYVVPQEIPPGGQVTFTLRPSTPLSAGPGGRFTTDVSVASFEVLPRQGGPASPTAGARAVEPSPYRPDEERARDIEPPY